MADVIIGAPNEVASHYHADGVLRADVEGTADEYVYRYVQGFEFTADDTNVERIFLDNGAPAFAQVGDVKGSFQFDLKKSVSLFETGTAEPDDKWLASYWLRQVAARKFPEMDFTEVMKAGQLTTNEFGRIKFECRIMGVTTARVETEGAGTITVRGDVLDVKSARREDS